MVAVSPLHTLLAGSVDYAGLFAPAALDMRTAVRNYAAYLSDANAWMLGRLVLPANRLAEFEQAYAELGVSTQIGWRLSALLGDDLERDFAQISDFNGAHADLQVDAVEAKLTTPAAIARAAMLSGRPRPLVDRRLALFVEVPTGGDPASIISAISEWGVKAKIRTGGVSPDVFPPTSFVVRFLRQCIDTRVPFKATAGLHHALRGNYALTYDAAPERSMMFGYLNLLLAEAFMCAGLTDRDAGRLLEDADPAAFAADERAVRWRDRELSLEQVREARALAIAFGSCSFEEPVAELRALGLAP